MEQLASGLRVAQISPLFESVPPKGYGGTERVVYNLTQGLLDAGAEVTVFCSGDSNLPKGAHHEALWPEALRLAKTHAYDAFAYQTLTLGAVARKAHEFDIIHNHYDYGLLPLSDLTTTPTVSTTHGRMDGLDSLAAFGFFPNAPLVSISDSQRAPARYLRWIATIHHGIHFGDFEFHEAPGKYLAFLGRFSPEKRPEWAIDMAIRSGIPLKIAAKMEPDHIDYFENRIKPRIDGKFIEYVGEISEQEKSEFLGNAVALAFPIDWPEPFGLVMIEAMACGTPVLTRPVGAAPEVMREGVSGFVRSNVDELGDLVAAAAKLDRTKVRAYAEECFSIKRMTMEYLDAYRVLTTEARGNEPANIRAMAGHRRNLVHSVDRAPDRDSKNIA